MESGGLPRGAPRKARIRPSALGRILDAWREGGTDEPCGLLLGHLDERKLRIEDVVRTGNDHASPDRAFKIPPSDHAAAQRVARERGFEVIGAWHGHRHGAPEPGVEDERGLEAFETVAGAPRALLIVGRGAGRAPVVRGYARSRSGIHEIPLART